MSWSIFDFKQKFKKIRAHEYIKEKNLASFSIIIAQLSSRNVGNVWKLILNLLQMISFTLHSNNLYLQHILFFATSKVKVRIHESNLLFSSIRFHLLLPLPHSYQLYIWNNCVFHVNYCNFESMTLNINNKTPVIWNVVIEIDFLIWKLVLNKYNIVKKIIVWKNKNNSDAI
jgi:hypothetical protein